MQIRVNLREFASSIRTILFGLLYRPKQSTLMKPIAPPPTMLIYCALI